MARGPAALNHSESLLTRTTRQADPCHFFNKKPPAKMQIPVTLPSKRCPVM